ncbi:hypothetical protein [Piscirickettsia salmonis]|uniref:hypothetical protein n=1 Tax=Piscirickettsia salmonis TaxID=1238 RepID=UPI0007C97FB3|nr:hypothetical protein A0O36_02021 [Piscirickettsiaceae bacterium NZ-RLO1]
MKESLATAENIQLLALHPNHALQLALAMNYLNEDLATPESLQLLAQHAENAFDLTLNINQKSAADLKVSFNSEQTKHANLIFQNHLQDSNNEELSFASSLNS